MRCSKCDGCIGSFNECRPDYCMDGECPNGQPEPKELQEEVMYKLIEEDCLIELEKRINAFAKQGYELINISCYKYYVYQNMYIAAMMIKETPE